MYEELIQRLREIHPEEFGNYYGFAYACQQVMHEAANAIEKLCSFVGAEDAERMEAYPPKEE